MGEQICERSRITPKQFGEKKSRALPRGPIANKKAGTGVGKKFASATAWQCGPLEGWKKC